MLPVKAECGPVKSKSREAVQKALSQQSAEGQAGKSVTCRTGILGTCRSCTACTGPPSPIAASSCLVTLRPARSLVGETVSLDDFSAGDLLELCHHLHGQGRGAGYAIINGGQPVVLELLMLEHGHKNCRHGRKDGRLEFLHGLQQIVHHQPGKRDYCRREGHPPPRLMHTVRPKMWKNGRTASRV